MKASGTLLFLVGVLTLELPAGPISDSFTAVDGIFCCLKIWQSIIYLHESGNTWCMEMMMMLGDARRTVTMQKGRIMDTRSPFPPFVSITHLIPSCCDVTLHHSNTNTHTERGASLSSQTLARPFKFLPWIIELPFWSAIIPWQTKA